MAISRRKNRAGRIIGYTVIAVVPNARGGRGARHVIGTYRTRKLAEDAERRAKDQIQAGTFDPTPPEPTAQTTVADAVALWYDSKRNAIQENSATGYESAIRLHVRPALGTLPVANLTHDHIQRQVNAWRDAGMGARLLHRCVMVLRASLARQVKNGTIPFNPADGLEKPSARTHHEFTVWDDREFDRFLEQAGSDRLAPVWFLTLLEGFRRGEALGLRWRDLHWSADASSATATIAQTIVPDLAHGGRALVQARAKTKGSQRTVLLTESTVAILKAHRDRQRFERQALPNVWGGHDLITTTSIGTPITPSSVKRELWALIERAGVPRVTTHGLRHMTASLMLKAGVSPALVALKLGHADIGTTVDRYGHLAVTDQASANAAMEAVAARGRASRTGTEHA